MESLSKKNSEKIEEIRKLVTRTPVSPKGSYTSAPKKPTSGFEKKNFSLDPFYRGLMKQHT
jgi:hypothetical protein